jgi:23S rRNA pseudouridine1911/1915/1917 synthase
VINPPHNFVISSDTANQRLDIFLNKNFPDLTRSHLQSLISKSHILVNEKSVKSGYKLKKDDLVSVVFPPPEISHIEPQDIPLKVIHEDNDILVIDNLVVHPGAGNKTGTLVNALLHHCDNLSGINGVLRPGIVHRLDKNTSGLIVVAKNDDSHLSLTRQFETREIKRTYLAIVWGTLQKSTGQIETLIDRSIRDRKKMAVSGSRGRQAVTYYEVKEMLHYHSLLRLTLGTGRTHQIRVHLNHIKHPVFGDPEYNGRLAQINRIPSPKKRFVQIILQKLQRQALHATGLSLTHPNSKKQMIFKSDLPDDMKEAWSGLKDL